MSKGAASPPSIRPQFQQAAANKPSQPKPAAKPIPQEIKNHKPAMNGPTPPANVRAAVHRQVRTQQASMQAQRSIKTPPKPMKQPMTRKTEFNLKARPTSQQFNQAARKK
ncbi:MAG: hypothetical protein KC643_27300 [Nitrospira sp.]|nr:hypothetical protein [Nitrospira sp.]